MTFGDEYLTHLRVIQNIGMAGIVPVMHKGVEIHSVGIPENRIARSRITW